jgi:hypothetical protein
MVKNKERFMFGGNSLRFIRARHAGRRLGCLLLCASFLLPASCARNSEQSQEVATTTEVVVDQSAIDAEILEWFNTANSRFGELPNTEGFERTTLLAALSSVHTSLLDFISKARRNPIAEISVIGADWMQEVADSMGQLLDSVIVNNKEAMVIAVGKWRYLVSEEKKIEIGNCIDEMANC